MNNSDSQNIPFRLTIGVTGHRKLENSDAIRKTIRNIANDILSRFSGTAKTEVKLCCLSPLAEGADRLVASEILKYPDTTLKTVLPLTISDYQNDFETSESKMEFSELLKRSQTPMSLRKKTIAEEYPNEIHSEARSVAYEQVGKFVVQNCDILIGIWDGKTSQSRGGTANIIKYAEKENCSRYIVYTDQPDKFKYIDGDKTTEALFKKVNKFNGEKRFNTFRNSYIKSIYSELFENPIIPEGQRLSPETRNCIKNHLIPFYVDASTTAKHYQKIYRRTGLAVFWMAFTAMALVGMGAVFWRSPPAIFIIEFFILSFITSLLYYADKIKRSHKNWMEYRFLTERIRAAFFLSVCNIEPTQINTSRRSTSEGGPEAWMGIVFEEIWNSLPSDNDNKEEDPYLIKDYIEKAWIDDQISFHDKTCSKNRLISRRLETVGETVFYIAIAAAATHVIAPVFISWFHNWFVEHTLTLIALTLPTLGATIESIRSHRAYKHIARSSKQMYINLSRLRNTYEIYHPDLLERYAKEAEQMMLKESEEWLTVMSFSELYKAV